MRIDRAITCEYLTLVAIDFISILCLEKLGLFHFFADCSTMAETKRMNRSRRAMKLCFLLLCCFMTSYSTAQGTDTLEAGNTLRDWEFLESPLKHFQLKFFSPSFSTNRYLGIQYTQGSVTRFIWVANRARPLMDTSGVLNLSREGVLSIDYNGTSIVVNSERLAARGSLNESISVTLLDSGNLVLRAGQQVVWQSFDYPTDAFLLGMKLGLFELKSGRARERFLTSWLSPSVPASGAFTMGVDPNNTKRLVIWRLGELYWQSGDWNGTGFSFFPGTGYFPFDEKFKFSYITTEDESYYTLSMTNNYVSAWIALNSSAGFEMSIDSYNNSWSLVGYSLCQRKAETESDKGCIAMKPSECSKGDEFVLTSGSMESGSMRAVWNIEDNSSLGINDCEEICRFDCSCNAYASFWPNGTGCMFSEGQKRKNSETHDQNFFIRERGI